MTNTKVVWNSAELEPGEQIADSVAMPGASWLLGPVSSGRWGVQLIDVEGNNVGSGDAFVDSESDGKLFVERYETSAG